MANSNPTPPPNNKGKTWKHKKKSDPREIAFKRHYTDPSSNTFCNVRGSALRAGYSETYASNISVQKPRWWRELMEDSSLQRAHMLHQAEYNLNKTLEQVSEDTTDKKLKHDTSKFISERLGKDHYSTRKELTDKGGKRLFLNNTQAPQDVALEDLFVQTSVKDIKD